MSDTVDPVRMRVIERWINTPPHLREGTLDGWFSAAASAEALAEKRRRRYIPPALRAAVLDGQPCVYCGDDADCIDHLVPVSQGGTSIRENLAPACTPCNEQKLDHQPWQWKAWREENGLPWPPEPRVATLTRLLEAELSRRRELTDSTS